MTAVAAAGMAGTAAAVSPAGAAAPAGHLRTISYVTGPCFGACPVYKVTISSDGRGVFEGVRFTAAIGRHPFRVTPAQWRAFRDRLQALHGHGTVDLTGPPACTVMASDMASVEVRWSGAWRPHTLRANYGCDGGRYGWMYAHLRRAPDALPIARLVGPSGRTGPLRRLPPARPSA